MSYGFMDSNYFSFPGIRAVPPKKPDAPQKT